jgi:hypothetical protein
VRDHVTGGGEVGDYEVKHFYIHHSGSFVLSIVGPRHAGHTSQLDIPRERYHQSARREDGQEPISSTVTRDRPQVGPATRTPVGDCRRRHESQQIDDAGEGHPQGRRTSVSLRTVPGTVIARVLDPCKHPLAGLACVRPANFLTQDIMSTKDQALSAALHGEALLAAQDASMQPLLDSWRL